MASLQGEFLAFIHSGDELAADALLQVAAEINRRRECDLVYADEDRIDEEGRCSHPFYKPDWSPDYLLSANYISNLSVYRSSVVRLCGFERPGYDLALRVTCRTSHVNHIPRVLYHSLAAPEVEKDTGDANRAALERHLERERIDASVESGLRPGLFRVRYRIAGQPRVSIVVPTAGLSPGPGKKSWLDQALDTIDARTTWSDYEIIVIGDGRLTAKRRRDIALRGVLCKSRPITPFNFSSQVNYGASFASGEHILILNDDIEVIAPGWIEALLKYSQQERIGAVGARLYYPNGTIQHAGIVCVLGNFANVAAHQPPESGGYFNSVVSIRNFLAVTGACLMVKTGLFRLVGGFNAEFAADFNDVDFCLRLHEKGFRNVYTPYAELVHYESASSRRTVSGKEIEMLIPWTTRYGSDPYYSINFSTDAPYR